MVFLECSALLQNGVILQSLKLGMGLTILLSLWSSSASEKLIKALINLHYLFCSLMHYKCCVSAPIPSNIKLFFTVQKGLFTGLFMSVFRLFLVRIREIQDQRNSKYRPFLRSAPLTIHTFADWIFCSISCRGKRNWNS